ncbi:uncharacterized protein CLUP02_14173 [Colletotrichum lupini]|uniref:Uncharacterized protein n=1 Tax=Colletotrichum lupini TaxID=145971 RepID=A0A9Q8T3T6_9PEZI|nr:uncharacterized protein CLUP02_14173 [Colletotrichum lupini]UQC88648.1 hypothetical protein CLUP02_14173 [Colletotrichum lupini]
MELWDGGERQWSEMYVSIVSIGMPHCCLSDQKIKNITIEIYPSQPTQAFSSQPSGIEIITFPRSGLPFHSFLEWKKAHFPSISFPTHPLSVSTYCAFPLNHLLIWSQGSSTPSNSGWARGSILARVAFVFFDFWLSCEEWFGPLTWDALDLEVIHSRLFMDSIDPAFLRDFQTLSKLLNTSGSLENPPSSVTQDPESRRRAIDEGIFVIPWDSPIWQKRRDTFVSLWSLRALE